jgi:L-lactate dehydrogenase (cytochrome)
VVKALCLGARGVGLGRPFMYSLTYGEEGVRHAIDSEFSPISVALLVLLSLRLRVTIVVLRDEVQTTMRLLGVTRVSQLGPHLVRLCRCVPFYRGGRADACVSLLRPVAEYESD